MSEYKWIVKYIHKVHIGPQMDKHSQVVEEGKPNITKKYFSKYFKKIDFSNYLLNLNLTLIKTANSLLTIENSNFLKYFENISPTTTEFSWAKTATHAPLRGLYVY